MTQFILMDYNKRMAIIISKFFIFFYRFRYGSRVKFGKNVIINHRFKIKGQGKLVIGDNVNLWAHEEKNRFMFYGEKGEIKVGSDSRLNGLDCHCHCCIKIGQNCLIGSAILIDNDMHKIHHPDHVMYGRNLSQKIEIKDHVWIAGQAVVLKGSQIGAMSMVGFRAVVAGVFPQKVLLVGNPARIVRSHNSE